MFRKADRMTLPTLTLRHVLVVAVFALVAIINTRPHVNDPDMPWHIRSGQIMLENRDVIRGDLFSHTLPGVLRPHHEWLSEVIVAGLYNAFGNYGVVLMAMFFTLGACYTMYRITRGDQTVRLLLVVMAALATTTLVMSRPQGWMLIFTLILVNMVLKRGPSPRWIPVMMFFWINLHGGWITGYVVLSAGIVAEFIRVVSGRGDVVWLRRLVLGSLAGVVAMLINPYGVEQLLVPLDTFTQAARPFITEWSPPDLLALNRITYVILLYIGVVVVIVHGRRMGLTEFFLLVGFGVWSLMTARIVLLYGLVAPVILAPYITDFMRRVTPSLLIPDYRLDHPVRLGALVAGFLVLAAFAVSLLAVRPQRIDEILRASNHPVDAVAFLKDELAAGVVRREMLNSYNWGGYVIWELPEYPVFIDTRADLYDDFFFVYYNLVRLEGDWEATLAEYDIETVLIGSQTRLANALREHSGWRIDYEDDVAVIFRPAGAP